jgi:hypothetical protein
MAKFMMNDGEWPIKIFYQKILLHDRAPLHHKNEIDITMADFLEKLKDLPTGFLAPYVTQ